MTRFQKLTLLTAIVTYLVVVMGAITRSTGSGMGCGYEWPLCHGVLPPIDDLPAWIEWFHRLLALTIGLLITAVLVVAVLRQRDRPVVLGAAVLAFVLVLIQAQLGQITVVTGNASQWVVAHLATAMLVLAVLTFIAIRVRYPGRFGPAHGPQRFAVLALITALAVYALLLVGSQVTATAAALIYPDWPLFGGAVVPAFSATPAVAALQEIQVLHRWAAAAVGILVLATMLVAWRAYPRGGWGPPEAAQEVRRWTAAALILYIVQVGVGALQIWTTLAAWAVALHVALGAAIWALLVAATTTAYCAARSARAVPTSMPMASPARGHEESRLGPAGPGAPG